LISRCKGTLKHDLSVPSIRRAGKATVEHIRQQLQSKIPSKLNKDLYGNPDVDEEMLRQGNLTEVRSRKNLKFHKKQVVPT